MSVLESTMIVETVYFLKPLSYIDVHNNVGASTFDCWGQYHKKGGFS